MFKRVIFAIVVIVAVVTVILFVASTPARAEPWYMWGGPYYGYYGYYGYECGSSALVYALGLETKSFLEGLGDLWIKQATAGRLDWERNLYPRDPFPRPTPRFYYPPARPGPTYPAYPTGYGH